MSNLSGSFSVVFTQFLPINIEQVKYQAYLVKLNSAQTWHMNRTLTTLKCSQDALTSKFLYQGDVEAQQEQESITQLVGALINDISNFDGDEPSPKPAQWC